MPPVLRHLRPRREEEQTIRLRAYQKYRLSAGSELIRSSGFMIVLVVEGSTYMDITELPPHEHGWQRFPMTWTDTCPSDSDATTRMARGPLAPRHCGSIRVFGVIDNNLSRLDQPCSRKVSGECFAQLSLENVSLWGLSRTLSFISFVFAVSVLLSCFVSANLCIDKTHLSIGKRYSTIQLADLGTVYGSQTLY